MQTTKSIHPGGKSARAEPQPLDDEVRHHGDVDFHRLVPNVRGQSKAEDDVGTKENIEVQEKDETLEEVVKGHLYAWASNICHLEDTKVKVEDLSNRNIDPQLAQNTQELLSKILKCDATELQVGEYSKSEQHKGYPTEEFTVPGSPGEWRVCRKTYYNIDAREGPNSQYSTSTTAKRILAEASAKAGPPPSDAQVKHVACRILAEDRAELRDQYNRVRWSKLVDVVHEELYSHRGDADFESRLTDELNGNIKPPVAQSPELAALVEQNLPRRKGNEFHQFILDGEASNACERIEGFDVVILRDGKHELICGVVTRAVQKLFPEETVDKMSSAAEAFAWRFPYKRPDDLRHPTSQAVHLAAHPEKDARSTECQQPHFAVCGVEHYGLHHETGHRSGFNGLCFQKFYTCRNPRLLESTAWKEEFPKLKGGVYGVAAKVSRLVLEAWDQKLYEDYLGVRQHLPEELKVTLATTGNYEGIRHSLVLTNKESVRKTIPSLDERLEHETERAAQLQSKDPKDWSDDEIKLHQAYMKGKNPMLEYTWSLIKNEVKEERKESLLKRGESVKRKAAENKSNRDRPEGSPKKEAKKTKKGKTVQ
ncbi:hypothetical protein SLS64_013847 [Diaporthe eres]